MSLENLSYDIEHSDFFKTLSVPTSKSYANRVIVLAALNPKPVIIRHIPESSDVRNMLNCLERVGLKIRREKDEVVIENSFPHCEVATNDIIELHTGDGGTTNRFIIPLLALGKNKYNLIPEEKMSERPMREMERILEELNVTLDNEENWFCLQGPINNSISKIEVDCSKTTQFATGFLLALSHSDVEVEAVNLVTSVPYYEMTKELVRNKEKTNFIVPADFSSLSYPLAMASLNGSVHILNCTDIDEYQADSEFLKILKEIDISISISSEGLKLEGCAQLRSFEYDCKSCPDLIPTLCFLASYCNGTSKIKSVEVLRHKECDRLDEMLRMMNAFGVEAHFLKDEDAIKIVGRKPHRNAVDFTPERDHRMVMVASMFQMYNGGGKIYNAECVNKSFPTFFDVML